MSRTKRKYLTPKQRLAAIEDIIDSVEMRCMAVDGPVTPTLKEMSEQEMRSIYLLACAAEWVARGVPPKGASK